MSGYRVSGPPVITEWLGQSEDVVLLLPVPHTGRWVGAAVPRSQLDSRSTAVPSIDNERMARLDLDGFTLAPASGPLAEVAAATAGNALARASLLRASLMAGGCAAVLERTASYALERVQFGQVIGAFQAVRHHAARIAIAADAARLVCNEALTRADAGEDVTAIGAVALFAAGRSYVTAVLTAAQVHGGVGTTTEHVLHHHFRRAKAMQLRTGKRASPPARDSPGPRGPPRGQPVVTSPHRVAVVTGGGRGLGRAVALQLAGAALTWPFSPARPPR